MDAVFVLGACRDVQSSSVHSSPKHQVFGASFLFGSSRLEQAMGIAEANLRMTRMIFIPACFPAHIVYAPRVCCICVFFVAGGYKCLKSAFKCCIHCASADCWLSEGLLQTRLIPCGACLIICAIRVASPKPVTVTNFLRYML
jgi:hypothetical protein